MKNVTAQKNNIIGKQEFDKERAVNSFGFYCCLVYSTNFIVHFLISKILKPSVSEGIPNLMQSKLPFAKLKKTMWSVN